MEKRIIIDLFDKVNLETHVASVDIPNLSLLKAGRFDEDYPVRVNTLVRTISMTANLSKIF